MKRPLPFHSRNVWPPPLMVALFVFVYGVLTGGLWLMQLRMGNILKMENIPFDVSDMKEWKTIHAMILGFAAVVYAMYRLWRFHPACNWPYAAWLRLTPWTADQPLPLGPVHPVWQDAAVIGLLMAIAKWHAHISPALPLVAYGMTYLIIMTILLAATRIWPVFLTLGFLWPALLLPGAEGWPSIVVVAALVLVVWQGHRKSLQTFPWRFLSNSNRTNAAAGGRTGLNIEISADGLSGMPVHLGWPYLVLSPKIERRVIPASTSFSISALAGWWTYCTVISFRVESLSGLILAFAVVAALLRLVIYCAGVEPPFNFLGRFASGQSVLSDYDKVFLTPLASVLIAVAGGMMIRHSGSWYPVTESSVVALLLFVLLTGGPTRRSWILTGQLRFRPALANRGNNQMLRRV